MASHGVARTVRTRTEEQRQQDLEKITKYRELESEIRRLAATGNYSDPALYQLTSKLLRLNPEYYTIWNVRRRCLISGSLSKPSGGLLLSKESPNSSLSATTKQPSAASSPSPSDATPRNPGSQTTGPSGTTTEGSLDDATGRAGNDGQAKDAAPAQPTPNEDSDAAVLQSELSFTIPLLLEFPKCYWIWKFRRWVLEEAIVRLSPSVARDVWLAELALDSKMLTKDRRNFHAWSYRRDVIARLESTALVGQSMVEEEFAYTTRMINLDLSNFSAWHNRSQLIHRLLDERNADDATRKAFLDKELGLVREALNVGPEDQSLWYYHRFLISDIVDHAERPTIAPALKSDERVAYVQTEIEEVTELLEDYADIKWIYEALLEYAVALQRLDHTLSQARQAGATGWLEMLQKLDPMRRQRWNDIENQLRA